MYSLVQALRLANCIASLFNLVNVQIIDFLRSLLGHLKPGLEKTRVF